MKKIWFSILWLGTLLWARPEHYAKLQPYETYVIKAAAAGQVMRAHDEMEGHTGTDEVVVQIDDRVDRAQKKALETTLRSLERTLQITETMAENQKSVARRDRRYYERIKNLKTKSQTEKDRVFAKMAASENQWLSLKEKMATLKKQIADTKAQIFQLEDRIAKKAVRAKGLYIYKVAVREGDYVNPGTLLLKAMDLRKGRLILYLDPEEVEGIGKKKIYLDGKPTDLKFEKVLKVADETHLSSYRGEIVIDHPEGLFSRLLKVEIR